MPPHSVRCTRVDQLKLASFRNLGKLHRYNSPDCPVYHQTVRCASGATATSHQWSTANAFNALQCAPELEHAQLAHRTVYRTCPVRHRTTHRPHQSELQRSNPNSWVTWLAHRTVFGGAPDCPVRHATAHFQRPFLVVGAINTPTTPHSMASKFSTFYTLQEL